MKIILASASKRRAELLSQIKLPFETVVSQIDESKHNISKAQISPHETVMELSKLKAFDVFAKTKSDVIVIGSDTLVYIENELLGKPVNSENAFNMLKKIQGKTHSVYTGLCVVSRKNSVVYEKSDFDCALVNVKPMTDSEIMSYIKTKEPFGKAGAYAIQGLFSVFINSIKGDYYSVVGLPISKLYELLTKHEKFSINLTEYWR